MKKNQVIGLLLLILAILTILGMVISSDAYWTPYNYFTIILSVISGMILLKQK